MPTTFQFTFEGKPVDAREGQSVAAALLAAGERCLRIDEAGNAKGRCAASGFAGNVVAASMVFPTRAHALPKRDPG
jgi:hypothetical protein